jgi:hypothetical protein
MGVGLLSQRDFGECFGREGWTEQALKLGTPVAGVRLILRRLTVVRGLRGMPLSSRSMVPREPSTSPEPPRSFRVHTKRTIR